MPSIEKRPGADWEVTYLDVPTGVTETMTIFGASTIDEALRDAKQSLFSPFEDDDADETEILSITRVMK